MKLVGENAAYFCSGQKDDLRPLGRHPLFDRSAGLKINSASIRRQENATFACEPAHQRASDKTTVAGNPNTLSVQIKAHPILKKFLHYL